MPDPSFTQANAEQTALIDQIDACLPQTQCEQCGFKGCKPYATAIALQGAPINRCPPGGNEGIAKLAHLLNTPALPLDPSCGEHKPRHIAHIAAEHCIGCTLCIKACPVDAIAGANKSRHVVIAGLCTGCELCIPPCPVDCIDMVYLPQHSAWTEQDAHAARARIHQRQTRLIRQSAEREEKLEAKALHKLAHLEEFVKPGTDLEKKRSTIEAALARARARRAHLP